MMTPDRASDRLEYSLDRLTDHVAALDKTMGAYLDAISSENRPEPDVPEPDVDETPQLPDPETDAVQSEDVPDLGAELETEPPAEAGVAPHPEAYDEEQPDLAVDPQPEEACLQPDPTEDPYSCLSAEPEADTQISDQLSALYERVDQLAAQGNDSAILAGLEAIGERLGTLETRLSDLAMPPKLELSDQREMMARFTTAVATIGRRQDQAVLRLEEQLKTSHDRLDHQITVLEQAAEDSQQTRQALARYAATFKEQLKEALETIASPNGPDVDELALKISSALRTEIASTLPEPRAPSDIADDLMRDLRAALAEVLAESARQVQMDGGTAAGLMTCEK